MRSPILREKVERFLGANGLRLEAVDTYCVIESPDGEILAGGGIQKDTIKCLAVAESVRSEGLLAPIVSRLMEIGGDYPQRKVFTKPGNRAIFESLGFHLIAAAPEAILLTDGKELDRYCQTLCQQSVHGRAGVIVMNANPFTRGHAYLIEKALEQVDRLFLIPVREDVSRFPYTERKAMMEAATADDPRITVLEGSEWQISALTFPTYFLKDLSTAAETQMRLDIDLFARHIAPALGIDVRFVGSEPNDALTARYNALMQQILPERGIELIEIPRLTETPGLVGGDAMVVSASRVRAALDAGRFGEAAALVPETTMPYLLADLAAEALKRELDAPLKPGLVGPDGPGAHADMDYALMQRSIAALRPWFGRMAASGLRVSGTQKPDLVGVLRTPSFGPRRTAGLLGTTDTPTYSHQLRRLGIEAEKAMLEATGGVNTHRGAIFALGLALAVAASRLCGMESPAGRSEQVADIQSFMQSTMKKFAHSIFDNALSDSNFLGTPEGSHGRMAVSRYNIRGAREIALDGYRELFADWLPCYRACKDRPFALQRTLLLIMAGLDDTCILHRAGFDRALQVKREAKALLDDFSEDRLQDLCARYAAEGISPGGAADMLALILFIDTITS